MRIFNIIQCANLGGMEQSNLALLTELKSWGHEVELLSLNPLAGLAPLLVKHGIPAEGLPYRGRGGWRSVPQLKRRLANVHSDALIMTGHNLLAMLAMGNLCRGRRLLKIHFHHTGVKPAWQWRLIYRAALAQFSAVTFPSDFIRREAEAIYPPIARISHTIGCPITLHERPTEAERMQARRVLGLPEKAHIMGNAGWLIPRKRLDVFLQVARSVAAADPDALFVIAGEGPETASLKVLASELGIAERVRWLGWQSDLTAFYSSLDLLLFNAEWEALGRTPLEGLAAGVPVVCSVLHGGLSEILDSSHYRLIFTNHDIAGMTEASLCVLRDPASARDWVDVARAHLRRVASKAEYANRVYHLLDPSNGWRAPQERPQ
jgi:glycosyltransferase involved in cell wall biosynthesis